MPAGVAPGRLRRFGSGDSLPQPPVFFRPTQPVPFAMLRTERSVESISLEPEAVSLRELLEALARLARALRLESRERFAQNAPRDRVRVPMGGAKIGSARSP